jgi:hypothetical protein
MLDFIYVEHGRFRTKDTIIGDKIRCVPLASRVLYIRDFPKNYLLLRIIAPLKEPNFILEVRKRDSLGSININTNVRNFDHIINHRCTIGVDDGMVRMLASYDIDLGYLTPYLHTQFERTLRHVFRNTNPKYQITLTDSFQRTISINVEVLDEKLKIKFFNEYYETVKDVNTFLVMTDYLIEKGKIKYNFEDKTDLGIIAVEP